MIQIIGLILVFATGVFGGFASSWFNEKPQPQLGVATTIGIRQGGTQTSTVPANAQFLIGNDTLYVFSAIPNCNTEGTDKLLFNSSTFVWTCGADQTGTTAEAGWRGDGIHTRLTTSTNRVGIGATSTLDYKVFIQSTAIGSSTLILRGTSTQTANLFQTQDIDNVISFFITPGGLASSTEFRSPSSTIATFRFTNASGTNISASGFLQGDTLRVAATSSLANVSSTNVTASGFLQGATLNISGNASLAGTSSTNLRASGYLAVVGRTDLAAASGTNIEGSGYLRGDTLRITAQSDLGSVSSTNLEASGYLRSLGRSLLDAVSSTNLRASGYLEVVGRTDLTVVSSTNSYSSGYLTVIGRTDLAAVTSTNLEASGYLRVIGRTDLAAASATNLTLSGTGVVTGAFRSAASTTMPTYASCETLETDANGLVVCGTDATGAGGGSSTITHVFDLGDAILPNSAFPSFDKTSSTNWMINHLSFDATASECAFWQWTVASTTYANSQRLNINWFTTSGTSAQFVTWDVDMRFASSGQLLDASTSSARIQVSGSSTIPSGSTSTVQTTSINVGSSTLILGRSLGQLKVCRDVTEDDATGDAKLLPMTWESTN